MKKILIALVVIIALSAELISYSDQMTDDQKYRTEKISKGDIVSIDHCLRHGECRDNCACRHPGLRHDKGDLMRTSIPRSGKVQLIAQIDPALFEAQVDQARANLVTSKANLAKADVAVVDTKANAWERNRQLFAKNLIARSRPGYGRDQIMIPQSPR